MSKALAAALLACVALAALAPAQAEAPAPFDLAAAKHAAAAKGLAYLAGVAAGGAATSDGMIEAIEGLGLDPGLWPTPESNVLDRLYVPDVGTLGNDPIREIEAYAQTGYPLDAGGRDLVADLRQAWDGSAQGIGQAAFTVLGLHAAGLPDSDPTIQDAVGSLVGGQATGGFWVCDAAVPPQDVDCTGFALTALASVHALVPGIGSLSKAFLDRSRNADGGYEEHPNPTSPGPSNSDSTVWAINGYRALGEPEPVECWRFVLAMQQPDGSFAWMRPGEKDLTRTFATKEVLASLWSSFAEWPVSAPAPVAHGPVHADVAAGFALPEAFDSAEWTAPGLAATGTPASLTFPEPGPLTIHLDASGDGVHARARLPVQVLNDAPVFSPTGPLDVQVGQPLDWTPDVRDPEGQALALSWTVAGQSGTGPLQATPGVGKWVATFTATDPHGASATLKVPLRVHAVQAVRAVTPDVEPKPEAEAPAAPIEAAEPDVVEAAPPVTSAEASPAEGTMAEPTAEPTPAVEPTADLLQPPTDLGLHADWTEHDGVVDVAASAVPAAYLTLRWCDATGCGEQAIVEGHAFLPAGQELRGLEVRARLGDRVEAAALGDVSPHEAAQPTSVETMPARYASVAPAVAAVAALAGVSAGLVALALRRR